MKPVSIRAFSIEVGAAQATLRSRLSEAKIKPVAQESGHDVYRLRDLVKAYLGGDIAAERLRKTKEEADRIALENDKTRGRLVEVEAVTRLGEGIFIAMRSIILASCLPTADQDVILLNLQSLKTLDWSKP